MGELHDANDVRGSFREYHGFRERRGMPLVRSVISKDVGRGRNLSGTKELDEGIVHGDTKGHDGPPGDRFFSLHLTFLWQSKA